MALAVVDLIQPLGYLSASMFPQDDAEHFEARVAAYLQDATARVSAAAIATGDVDDATRQWTHYRAYSAIYQDMARTPATATKADEGSKSTLAMQITEYKQLAAEAYRAYVALTPIAEPTATGNTAAPYSVSRRVNIQW